jgi:Family of unknown function (DUF5990)
MRSERFSLPLRIVVEDAIPGLTLALQKGHSGAAELVPPVRATVEAVVFDLEVTVNGALKDGRPRFVGPFVQGPPDGRFVYIGVGAYGGQTHPEWNGRVKLPLGGIGWAEIEALPVSARLAARIPGRAPKGGPALATVKLLPPGWVGA